MAVFRSRPRVGIIGAGIVGLSLAYELAIRRNTPVTIFDVRPPGRGASWAAAGMLAPAFEAAAEPGVHPRLFDLCMESAALWPAFAADVSSTSGKPVGFESAPSLAVALEATEAGRLEQIGRALAVRDVPHDVLDPAALLAREPALSPKLLGGLELPTDVRIDNRALVAALVSALQASRNVRFQATAPPLRSEAGRLMLAGHTAIVAAAGWETAVIKVEERGARYSLVNWDTGLDEIDCHGGQMLAVEAGAGAPQRVVRAGHIYIVPRGQQLVIGATTEPGRVIDVPEPAVIAELKARAVELCPGLAGAATVETWTGVRPGTPDHAPFLGETITPGLFVAAGHYRNGILLAPVTARILADQILGADPGELAATFSTRRAYAATA